MTTAPFLEVKSIYKSFADNRVLDGVDLDVQRGSVVCLIGRSGSGKSTLLRCINFLETPDAGEITLEGELIGCERHRNGLRLLKPADLAFQRRSIGMVFQRFNLFGHMTALENVMEAPCQVLGENRSEVRQRAVDLLAQVGLERHMSHYPSQLSGGQAQRVAIARTLAMRPKLILLDEPTSALDAELVGEVLGVVERLAESGMTMVIVTHEIGFAREVANEVHFVHQGRIVEHGPPSRILSDPENPATREFLSRVI